MKKLLYSAAVLALTLFAASCQQENLEPVSGGNTVTYTVQVPEAIATKAVGDEVSGMTLYYQVYRSAEVTTPSAKPVDEGTAEFQQNGVATLNLEFVKNQAFEVLFWAQNSALVYSEETNPGGMYNIADLRAVELKNPGYANNTAAQVFAGSDKVANCISATYGSVTLSRPISQLNIATSESSLRFGKTDIELVKSYVKVSGLSPKYNVYDKTVSENTTSFAYAFADVLKNAEGEVETLTVNGEPYHYVAMNYVGFANDCSLVEVDFSIVTSESTEDNPIVHFVTNVPVKPNHRTNIIGNLITGTSDYNVDLAGWANEEKVVEVWDGQTISQPAYDESTKTWNVSNAAQLAWVAASANGTISQVRSASYKTFERETVKLVSDIHLGGHDWTPISMSTNLSNGETFRGTFDGNGKVIDGLSVNQKEYAGLFGSIYAAIIKNVTIVDASIKSNHYAGGIVAWVLNHKGNIQVPFILENCHVKNSTIESTPELVGGEWDNGDKVGGLIGYAHFGDNTFAVNEEAKISNCSVNNTTVKAYRDFAGLVGYASKLKMVNTKTVNVTIEQDLTHDYKAPNTPTTFGLTIGRDNGGNLVDGYDYIADGVAKQDSNYYISNANGLVWVEAQADNFFAGKTIYLLNDIDMTGVEIKNPIHFWNGKTTVDGQNHTISNLTMSTTSTAKNPFSLFGGTADIKNIKFDKANISGYSYVAVVAGNLYGNIDNCHVSNSSVKCTYWMAGAMSGQYNNGNVTNCTVTNTTVTGPAAVGALVGNINESAGVRNIENCKVSGCTIAQNESFGAYYDDMFAAVVGLINIENSTVNFNNCEVENTTVRGNQSKSLYGLGVETTTVYVNGAIEVSTFEMLKGNINKAVVLTSDIIMTETLSLSGVSLDGNGHTITMAEDATNDIALFDITGGKVEIKNVTFDGIKGGAIIRTVGSESVLENINVKNCEHTQAQGLFRLLGKSTIKNCTFMDNTCSMAITLNYDGSNNDPQVVENCIFEGNTCNGAAVLYYVKGAGATIKGNKFIGNTVNCTNNGATVYMGFTEDNVVIDNLFQDNTVNESETSSRVAGAIFFGYDTVFEGNAFVGNKVTGEYAKGNDVCVSTYYTSIDLSGNYWGGNAPVEDVNYYVQHKSEERVVIINDYLTENPIN